VCSQHNLYWLAGRSLHGTQIVKKFESLLQLKSGKPEIKSSNSEWLKILTRFLGINS
jgi:hypothetical protein